MSKYLNDAYTLRIPAELKAKVAESAKAHNRSMNADMVARLEQSFTPPIAASSLEAAKKAYLNNSVNNLNYHLGCLEGKISACQYIIHAINNGTGKKYDNDTEMQKELFKFGVLLEQSLTEKASVEIKLGQVIQELQA